MDATTIALAVGFGIAIGLILGLVGGGGGILTVPILVYALGSDVHAATATSLVIVGAIAAFGAFPHLRGRRVVLPVALAMAATGIPGAILGTSLNERASGPVILVLFGAVMLVVAARMLRGSSPQPATVGQPVPRAIRWPVLATGFGVGVMTGFFGVGGGFLIVPALVLILSLPLRLAVGTSLVVIIITSAGGVLSHLRSGEIDWPLALVFITGGLVGALTGGQLSGSVNEGHLATGFAFLMASVGAFLPIRNGLALA